MVRFGIEGFCTAWYMPSCCIGAAFQGGKLIDELHVLQTNNPRKISQLEGLGVSVTGRIPCLVKPGKYSSDYLEAKGRRMDHMGLDGSWYESPPAAVVTIELQEPPPPPIVTTELLGTRPPAVVSTELPSAHPAVHSLPLKVRY
jgi:hypothetical protein